jgi:5'-3' exonuclease
MTEQPRYRKRFLDCSKLTMEEAEGLGEYFAQLQRDIMFWIGDLARYAEARWPDKHEQIWPEWVSPGLLARTAGVCRAYPTEHDRIVEATYSQYLQVAGKPDRLDLLMEMVSKGLTTDESRKKPAQDDHNLPLQSRWLLAVDCNYFLHRFWHSGAGVEAASGVASWIKRTVDRLKEKGLTDVACCFDSHINHRKELTKDWEDKYKDRPPKEPELAQQLNLVRDLIEKDGFSCISVEGMEADDVMASYAKQFKGKVTLLTQDKDQRQCLSATCNILLDVEWHQDEHSGDMLPEYKWLSAKQHTEATGITPQQWPDYQAIMGDNVDGVRGVEGIGEKGAADLIKQFGTIEKVIAAAKSGDDSIKPKKREAIIAFESKLEVTRKLVTLRDDLKVPESTRLT